jgi:class 3 adenylate cyclase
MNHEQGQYRAELFDKFVGRLLEAVFPQASVLQHAIVHAFDGGAPDPFSVDFVVQAPDGTIYVETKAPYTAAASESINIAIDRLYGLVQTLSISEPVRGVILAVPLELPASSQKHLGMRRSFLESAGTQFDLWDAAKLIDLAHDLLKANLGSFSIEELENAVGSNRAPLPTIVAGGHNDLPVGERENVVVLCADFCSFSAFVHASGNDKSLISSVMGRFYRESRAAITAAGGELDKYMGDGVLCYWFGLDTASQIEACVGQLVGIALNIAEEWQDQIDLSVSPKGLRAGAAIGPVLFIEERPGSIHAVSESINMASRLQAEASPNSLAISNRLRARHFDGRDDFCSMGVLKLKNIGDIVAWQKPFVAAKTGA